MLPRPPLATPTVTPFPVPTLFLSHARHIRAADPAPDGLIVASPANPTGTIIPPAELADLAAACRERGVRIISDEIYHRLSYGAETHSMLQYDPDAFVIRSEEHTSELQSLMRISYAVFCLKKKKN